MSNLNKIHKELTLLIVDIGHDLKGLETIDIRAIRDRIIRERLKEIRRLVKELQQSNE